MAAKPLRRARQLLACSVALLVAACGGGGGGGGPGGGAGSSTAITYSGSTTPAVVTTTNAGDLGNAVMGGTAASSATGLAGVAAVGGAPQAQAREGLAALGRRVMRASRARDVQAAAAPSTALAGATLDQTMACDSGSTRMFGTVDDATLTGTVTLTFNSCRSGGDTMNGHASMRIDAFDGSQITDMTLTVARLSFSGPGLNYDMSGTLRARLNVPANTETITENIVTLDNTTRRMTKVENLVIVNAYDNVQFPSSYTQSMSGRVYDGVHGYVDIATATPFSFATVDQSFPGGGVLVLTGASNRHLRFEAASPVLLRVGLDLNADNAYETSAVLKWSDLGTAVASDLGDTDGDGMHNSWETANGLNPSLADAGTDADSDSHTALAEYQAGSDPRNALSQPVAAAPPAPPAPGTLDPAIFVAARLTLAGLSDIAFDPVGGRLYAAVRGNPGSVVPVDPVTRTALTPIPVGAVPVRLAVSDNGQYLYVALDGAPSVQRIAIATGVVDLTFGLGSDPFLGPFYVEDMQVMPGNPQTIAASLIRKSVSPRHAGVAIFDNGVARANRTASHTGSNVIEFGAAGVLYGYNNESTEFGFRRMTVDAGGVTVNDVYDSFHAGGGLIDAFNADIRFGGSQVFSTTGRAIDPGVPGLVGTFGLPGTFGNLVVADPGLGRVFYLALEGGPVYSLRAFSAVTRAQLGGIGLGTVSGAGDPPPSSLVRYGTRGLAFRSGNDILFVESTTLIP